MPAVATEAAFEFPPALVRRLREHGTPANGCLAGVTDDALVRLLTTIFFAGLDTYEGEHNPISVVFVGRHTTADFVMPEGTAAVAAPLYRWKILRFAFPRPFAIRDLVKFGVAGADQRIYSAVGVLPDGRLAITGLAREGVNTGSDPFIRIVASRPGCLSIRSGRGLGIEYERGVIVTIDDDRVFSAGSVHRALETIARSAEVDDEVIPRYLDAVVDLAHEMVAHGRGGILIVSAEEQPAVADAAPYRMVLDSSLAMLLRLAWRVTVKRGSGPSAPHAPGDDGNGVSAARVEQTAFGALLRNAFLREAERVVEELGRLTAIDGAVLLSRALALVAFGVILPVRQQVLLVEGTDAGEGGAHPADFSSRGTRHRAGATYAADHPGSVVFVASEDGQVSCMLCEHPRAPVGLWRLTAETTRGK